MRKLLLSIAALVCTFSVSAQRATSSSSSFFSTEKAELPITFGVRGGVNFAGMSGGDGDDLDDGRVGFNFGVNVDIPLLQSLYLQTGLYATQKGAKSEENEDDIKYGKKSILSILRCRFLHPTATTSAMPCSSSST